MAIEFVTGQFADTAVDASDDLRVSVPNITQLDRVVYGPMSFRPHIKANGFPVYPTKGDPAVVATDTLTGAVWVVDWDHADSGAAAVPPLVQPSARRYHNAAQNLVNGTITTMLMNSLRWDATGMWEPASNGYRIARAGLYHLYGMMQIKGGAGGGQRILGLSLGNPGNFNNCLAVAQLDQAAAADYTGIVDTEWRFAANDLVVMLGYQGSGATLTTSASDVAYRIGTEFGITRIGD